MTVRLAFLLPFAASSTKVGNGPEAAILDDPAKVHFVPHSRPFPFTDLQVLTLVSVGFARAVRPARRAGF